MEINTKLNQLKHSNEDKQTKFNKLKQTRIQLKELKKFEGPNHYYCKNKGLN